MLCKSAVIPAIVLAVVATLTTPISAQTKDVIFVLDESSSMWEDDYKNARDLAAAITERIPNFGGDGNRVGVIKFADEAKEAFNLPTYDDAAEAAEAIKNLTYRAGPTLYHAAINLAKSSFDRLGHDQSSKVVILFTDGAPDPTGATTAAAKKFKDAGYVLIMVAIGTDYDEALMTEISGGTLIQVASHITDATQVPALEDPLYNCLYVSPEPLADCISNIP